MSSPPRLRDITLLFLRVSNLTFGGGDPIMAIFQRELVNRQAWLSAERYGIAYGLARVTPGTNILAFCAGAAWYIRGWPAALLGVFAATVPAAALVLWLTYAYQAWRSNLLVTAAVGGMLAAAVGIMAASAALLIRPIWKMRGWLRTSVVVIGAAVLNWKFSISPIPILAAAALAGYFWSEPVKQ